MKRLWVATDADTLASLRGAGKEAMALDAFTDPQDVEIVLVGPGAKEAMFALRAHGVPAERLSWFGDGRIKHFHWDNHRPLSHFSEPREFKYLPCGISGMTNVVQWRLPEVGVVAGPFGCGKTLFVTVLAQDFVRQSGLPALLTCWEDEEDEIRAGVQKYRDTAANFRPDEGALRDKFLDMIHVTAVDEDRNRRISEHFERVQYYAKRFGTKFFVLDPWNEFDHERHSKQTEGDYVINVLTTAKRMAAELKIIMLFTTHVSAEFISPTGDIKPFRLSNAFGSSQFGNQAHRGFCVVRSKKWGEQSHMVVRHDKAKQEHMFARNDDGDFKLVRKRMGIRETMVFEYSSKTNCLYWDRAISESDEVRKIWG